MRAKLTIRKIALITGGRRGIALAPAEVGFDLVINDLIRDVDADVMPEMFAGRVELYLMFNSAKMQLAKQRIKVGRALVGNYVSS